MKNNNKGFTLVELLAVIVILGVLLLIAVPSVSRLIENSKKKAFLSSYQLIIGNVKQTIKMSAELGDSQNFECDDEGTTKCSEKFEYSPNNVSMKIASEGENYLISFKGKGSNENIEIESVPGADVISIFEEPDIVETRLSKTSGSVVEISASQKFIYKIENFIKDAETNVATFKNGGVYSSDIFSINNQIGRFKIEKDTRNSNRYIVNVYECKSDKCDTTGSYKIDEGDYGNYYFFVDRINDIRNPQLIRFSMDGKNKLNPLPAFGDDYFLYGVNQIKFVGSKRYGYVTDDAGSKCARSENQWNLCKYYESNSTTFEDYEDALKGYGIIADKTQTKWKSQ